MTRNSARVKQVINLAFTSTMQNEHNKHAKCGTYNYCSLKQVWYTWYYTRSLSHEMKQHASHTSNKSWNHILVSRPDYLKVGSSPLEQVVSEPTPYFQLDFRRVNSTSLKKSHDLTSGKWVDKRYRRPDSVCVYWTTLWNSGAIISKIVS